MTYAPIALFVYNRPAHLSRTLYALKQNALADKSELYVFSDNGDDVDLVCEMIKDIKGFKKVNVHLSAFHNGLRNSIITGVNYLFITYDKVIVMEDDLVTSPNFLTYMNECLDKFKNNQTIGSITGYNAINMPDSYDKPVYLSPRPGSWGWATWRDRWDSFKVYDVSKKDKAGFNIGGDDLYRMLKRQRRGEIDSWAIDWAFTHYKKSWYCVYPCTSKVCNIGIGSGTNCNTRTTAYDVKIDTHSSFVLHDADIQPNNEMIEAFRAFWRYSLFKKFKVFINDTFVRPILRRMA